ncbi:rhamnan synthesis F family protein [Microbacterium aurum]
MKTAELVARDPRPANTFPPGGARLLIYVVYDRRGDVEEYIPYALTALRAQCQRIVVVVNGKLTDAGRSVLEKVSDEIVVRENRGYDIWGYKAGLDAVGDDLLDFDEVILANDTWFGPIRPFAPVFEQMDAASLHFWGLTDHVRVEPNPFTGGDYLPYHLQSYWFAARRTLFESAQWRDYWRDLPALDSYADAVVKHEATFTELLTSWGFVGEVVFPTITDRIENHAVLYAGQLIEQGCPTLKRRAFFQWPAYLDHLAVVGAWTLDTVRRYDYPMHLIERDLARNVEPRTLNADAALLNVLPDPAYAYQPAVPMRIVAIAHIYYDDMAGDMLDRLALLPGDFDLVVTTSDEQKADRIRDAIGQRPTRGRVEVRVVGSNNGRDQSAFLIDCRDVLVDGGYDLVVKIHSKRTTQDAAGAARHFQRQQFENLLPSDEYAASLVGMFQSEPRLGIVYPPMVHLGYGTIGHAWWDNRSAFVEMTGRLGISVPIDEGSPLAPYGSMYVARPEALAALTTPEWTYEEFGDAGAYKDGGLAHVLERMPSYAAGEAGYITRTIANADYLAASYTTLDYELDQFSSTFPDTTMDQIRFLKRLGPLGRGTAEDFAYIFARLRRPAWEPKIQRLADRARAVKRRLRGRG